MIYSDEEILKGLFTKNGNPRMYLENFIKKDFPLFNQWILERFNNKIKEKNHKEALYCIYHNLNEPPKCIICGKPAKFLTYKKGYSNTCSAGCSYKNLENNVSVKKNLTDDDIIKIFKTYSSKAKNRVKFLKTSGTYDYILNRYTDSKSIRETVYRIFNHIEKRPVCPICGKTLNFYRDGFRKYCSLTCGHKSADANLKRNKSCSLTRRKNSPFNEKLNIESKDKNIFIIKGGCKIHPIFEIRKDTFYNRIYDSSIELCPICNPERNPESSIEKIIKNLFIENNINFLEHNRTIIKPKELDFYLPDYRIGIECNGMFWHSYDNEKERLKEKELACKQANVRLITFWEDEIKYSFEAVKNILLSILGKNNIKLNARECTVKEITLEEAREFLDLYHIQHYVNSKIKLGLYYKNELVEVMTFGNLRKALGSVNEKNYYELYRLCAKTGITVRGGTSKLLSYFKKNWQWKEIISYCHKSISSGNIYEKLGFNKISESRGFTYFNMYKSRKRISRFVLRKNVIDDYSGRTADEILKSKGYRKCWDNGVIKYKLKNINYNS